MMLFVALICVLFGIIAWRDTRTALVALFGVLPTYLVRFTLGPLPTTLLEVFVLILVCISMLRFPVALLTTLKNIRAWTVPVCLLLLSACVATLYAPNTLSALGVLKAYFFEPAVVLVLCSTLFTSRAAWLRAGTALVVSGTIVALLALVQYATGLGIPAPWDMLHRTTSVYDFPNAVGLFLAPIITGVIVFLAQHWHTTARKTALVLAVAALIMIAAIVTAQTEAAYIAIPAGLLAAFILSHVTVRNKLMGVALLALVSVAAFAASGTVREKLLLRDVSGQARVAMWHETLAMLRDHPLTGAGLSGFPTAIAPYHDAIYFEIFQYPHNVLLTTWSELGLLGVIASVLLGSMLVRATLRNRGNPLLLVVFGVIVTMFVHGFVDVPFFKNDLALMTAGLLACAIALDTKMTA